MDKFHEDICRTITNQIRTMGISNTSTRYIVRREAVRLVIEDLAEKDRSTASTISDVYSMLSDIVENLESLRRRQLSAQE